MAVRPSRSEGTPRLQGLYIFGPKDPPTLPEYTSAAPCATAAEGHSIPSNWNQLSHKALATALNETADDCPWYDKKGTIIPRPIPTEWAETVLACAGVISFDAALCRGPRHLNSPAYGTVNIAANSPPSPHVPSKWAIATHAVEGCAGCGSAPEGWTVWGDSIGGDCDDDTCRFPLLAPPPVHSSNVKVARCPSGADVNSSRGYRANKKGPRSFIARCMECLRDRYCWGCSKWWCEKCFTLGQMDSVDGLYYKVREGLCTVCEKSDADRFGGRITNPSPERPPEAAG